MAAESQSDSLPKNTWRILGAAAVLLLILTVAGIGFISAGFFDPQPVGDFTAELPLQTTTVDAHQQRLTWLDYELPADNFSLQMTAAYQSGELDSGYGLAVGNDDSALVVAVSPTGYVFVADSDRPFLEWQPWPHVNGGGETNEIWLDKEGDEWTVRINRELLWNGRLALPAPQIGLWTASYNEPVTVVFQNITIYSD